MAHRVPVVVTAVGGVKDLLGDPVAGGDRYRVCERGLLVEAGRALGLAAAIRRISSDATLRGRLVTASQEYVQSLHQEQRCLSQLLDLYSRLAPAAAL
jgi:glycosyltransferase involved in cell wall biosynthesis